MDCLQVKRIQDGLSGWRVRDRLVDVVAAPLALALLGGGFALQILVAGACLPRMELTESQTRFYVVVSSLAWAAVGAWCPQQLVARLLKRIWTHVRRHEYVQDDLILLQSRATSDRVLRWLLVASLACAIGSFQLLMIPLSSLLQFLSIHLTTRFLWMPMTWSAAQFTLISLVLSVPSLMLGMLAAGLAAVCRTDGSRELRGPVPLLFAGAVLMVGLWPQIEPTWSGRPLAFLLVSVPLFAATILAVLAAGVSERLHRNVRNDPIIPTERISRDRFLIAAGLAIWAPLMAMWIIAEPTADRPDPAWFQTGRGPLLGMLLVGIVMGDWRMSRRKHSRCGAGTALWALGFASAVGGVIANQGVDASTVVSLGQSRSPAVLAGGLLAAGAMGYTLPYLVGCLIRRYPSPAFGYSLAASCLFGGGALGVVLTRYGPASGIDANHTLILLSLGAIAAGGGLIIYEPESSGRRRTIRLALVFASLALLMVLLRQSPAG